MRHAFIEVAAVEIVVIEFRRGRHAEAAEIFRFVEPAIHGAIRIVVAQVPLAEQAGAISAGGEDVGHGGEIAAKHGAAGGNGGRFVVQRVHAAHQLSAAGSAHGRGVEIGEADALAVQPVHIRRAQNGVAVAGEIAVALIVA